MDRPANLFSYILVSDSGFAPNPFWCACTLACCKPDIRRVAGIGDLIVGLAPKADEHKIVYVMRVTDKLTFKEYWEHPDFQQKKPFGKKRDSKSQCGDNIYRPLPNGQFRQERFHDINDEKSGRWVLVSDDFVYYGAGAVPLPPQFGRLVVGRKYRRFSSKDNEQLIAEFDKWFNRRRKGRRGTPAKWEAEVSDSEGACGKWKGTSQP